MNMVFRVSWVNLHFTTDKYNNSSVVGLRIYKIQNVDFYDEFHSF